MGNPLIILGAGASFDFLRRQNYPNTDIDLDWWIPPLTTRLFDGTKFHSLLVKYPEMSGMVGYIRSKLGKNTFEEILTKLYQEEVKNNPDLYKSFVALLFYLSELFGVVTEKYYRTENNYDILKHLLGVNGNKAVFVNFNYDLLLERAFGKDSAKYIDEYLKDDFPIIKIHGAYNWFWCRLVNAFGTNKQGSYELSITGAQYIFNPGDDAARWELMIKKVSEPRNIRAEKPDSLRAYSLHPAIALPLLGKDNFVCPPSHVEFLKGKLKEVDRIIIIGWKLGDQFVRNLVLEELKTRRLPIALIGGKDMESIFDGLEKEFKENTKILNTHGLSNFIGSDQGEEFFRK